MISFGMTSNAQLEFQALQAGEMVEYCCCTGHQVRQVPQLRAQPAMACVVLSETSGVLHSEAGNNEVAALLDKVNYTYVVTNNGTVTLTDFNVTDEVIAGTVCSNTTLAPGQTFKCYNNTYMVSICEQQELTALLGDHRMENSTLCRLHETFALDGGGPRKRRTCRSIPWLPEKMLLSRY